MSKAQSPFNTPRRSDSKTFQLTLNPTCGLPRRVCDEWFRRSFKDLPDELAQFRTPKNKDAADAAAFALIAHLKKKLEEEGTARRLGADDITVGAWLEKFGDIETSPRTSINNAKNRPPSYDTVDGYKSYYRLHIKNDPISGLKMSEVEEDDILEFLNRLSFSSLKDGRKMGGTRKYILVVSFMRTAFNTYHKKYKKQYNPWQYIPKPSYQPNERDPLTEDEMFRLFLPGVLQDTMELAVCAAMFLSGLRRAEVSALKPEDLDWASGKIIVRRSWQRFNSKNKVMGPPKGKKARKTLFDPVLQEAIKKLWAENGQHEFVFTLKKVTKAGKIKIETIGSAWIKGRFPKWLERAGIEIGGREIVPHSSRHSLGSFLEKKGTPLRYIQELLGHANMKTTIKYLHLPEEMIQNMGKLIAETREKKETEEKKIIKFKVS